MKKMNAFFFGAALGVAVLTSCSKDNNEPIITDFTITDKNLGNILPGDTLIITASLTDAEGLGKAILSVETNGNSVGTAKTTELSKTAFSYSETFVVPATASAGQNYLVKLTVQDDDKDAVLEDFISETVTVYDAATGTFTGITHASIVLEGCSSTTQANASDLEVLFNLTSGVGYDPAAANGVQSSIDIAYYYGSVNANTIASPDNDFINGPPPSNAFEFTSGWVTANATRFGASTLNFDNVTNAQIASISGLVENQMTALAVGQVFAFQTAAGKKGLIKVLTVASGNQGSASIAVKIQN